MERRALSHSALYANAPVNDVYHLLHERQSNARADVFRSRFALIERLENILGGLLVHAFTSVAHLYVQAVLLSPHRNVYLAVLGRELEGVGYEIVKHLVYIVGHEIHRHRLLSIELQVDVLSARIVAVSVHNHSYVSGDVAVSPVDVAHLRLYL